MAAVSPLDSPTGDREPWIPGSQAGRGVERVGVPLAESSYFATFADSSCHYALSALVLALSAKIIQKVNESSALYQLVQVFLC